MNPAQIAALIAKSVADAMAAHAAQASAKPIDELAAPPSEEIKAALFAPRINSGRDDRDHRKGMEKIGVFIKCLALGKSDPEHAAKIAAEMGDLHMAKSLRTTDFTSGGAMIPTAFLDDYFEALRPRSIIRRMGARVIDLVDGSATMPGITGGSIASYKEEGVAANAGAVTTGQVHLVEKELISILPVSTSMYRSRSGRNANMVAEDMLNGMAAAETSKFFSGTGANATPVGILNQAEPTNITAASGGTLLDADSDIAGLPNVLYTANVNVTNGVYFMNSTIMTNLKALRSGDNYAFPEMRGGPGVMRLNDFAFDHTNALPDGYLGFANMDDVIIGDSQSIEVTMSEEAAYMDGSGVMQAAFSKNEVVMRLVAKHDIGLRFRRSVAAKTGAEYSGS
jgi:HK97 family phage major capsid protein